MRKALLPVFLLVLGGVVLGATVFREQIVHAATPFQNVVITNTPTNPVQVEQAGTSSVSGTVKLDPAENTVSLDSSDSSHLAAIASHVASIDAAAGGTVSTLCDGDGAYDIGNGEVLKTLCSPTSGTWEVSTIVATGMDDNMSLEFWHGDTIELELPGDDAQGTSVYQLNLPKPLLADKVTASCFNDFEDCEFQLEVLGTTT